MTNIDDALVAVSVWVDTAPANAARDPEALVWHRVAKVAEEAGEVVEAMIGWFGGNPRKPLSDAGSDAVIKESLDTAMAALGAVEHLTGNQGKARALLDEHILAIATRAGVLP